MRSPAAPADTAVTLAVPGDDLCLAFANTRYWRGSAEPAEQMLQPADLLAWCTASGGVPLPQAGVIARQWEENPRRGQQEFARALLLRESLYRVFAAQAADSAAPADDVEAINHALARAPQRSRLVRTGDGFGWAVSEIEARAPSLLAPVLWSAGDLLAAPRRSRVRCCANDKCRWVFVDDSRAGTRRWCMMSACGNRAKAHRHYLKHRKA